MIRPILIREPGARLPNISELHFARIPQETFGSLMWIIGEPFTRFCSETIWMTINYLIFCGWLRVEFHRQKKRFPFRSLHPGSYLLYQGEPLPADAAWLEKQIEAVLQRRPGIRLRHFIPELLRRLERDSLPAVIYSRSLLLQLVFHSASGMVTASWEQHTFGKEYTVTVADDAASLLLQADDLLQFELLGNDEFRRFSEVLYRKVHRAIATRQNN